LKIKVTSLDPVSGKERNHYTLSSENDVTTPKSILFVGENSASPIIAWADKSSKVLKVNVIGSKHINSIDIPNESGEDITEIRVHAPHITRSLPHFLVHYQSANRNWAEVYHIDLSASTVSKAYTLPKLGGYGAFSTSTQDANVFFTRITENELLLLSSISHGVLARWETAPVASPLNGDSEEEHILHGVSEVISRSDSSYAVRSALVSSTGDWDLVRNGKPVWKRTEALAGAIIAEWAELPELQDLARELEVEVHENVLAAYIHRVKRHLRDLQELPKWIESLPARVLAALSGDETKVGSVKRFNRDSFGFRKLVIVATESGRLYALSTADQGKVVWNTKATALKDGEKWDVEGMYADNSEGLMIVQVGSGQNIVVETATGRIVPPDSGKRFAGTSEDDPILLSSGLIPRKNVTVITRGPNGKVQGKLYAKDGTATTAWEFTPSADERVTELTVRPFHDPVASIGRVLGDRSVMYKYLNPNLLLITTVSDTKTSATFTLLDSVSGNTLYSTTHHNVDTSRPIVSAMSENWFTYSFWSDSTSSSSSAKGYQLTISELYESPLPNDRGPLGNSKNFSSTASTYITPYVKSQSYVVPSSLSSLSITSTRQGITSRQLLAFLPNDHAIIAIPRAFLNPSRPVDRDPTPAEAEEGLIRYQPVLDFDPKWIITHKRDVMGVKKIITSPALLESTSLVFAYGIDIFGTRVAPSMAFDELGKGFNRVQLIGTVVALGAGVVLLAPMVSFLTASNSLTFFLC
jgi:ER membrane protein complex subunit 1